MRVILLICIVLCLTACATAQPEPERIVLVKQRYVTTEFTPELIKPCEKIEPPGVDIYTAGSIDQREAMLANLVISQYGAVNLCNNQIRAIAEAVRKIRIFAEDRNRQEDDRIEELINGKK